VAAGRSLRDQDLPGRIDEDAGGHVNQWRRGSYSSRP
jgi:hypothetical protein